MMRSAASLVLVVSVLATASAAQSKPALRDVPQIDEGLFTVGLADQIRKNCPDISARMFRALAYLTDLKHTARDLGYTRAEVEAHLDSDVEKDRLRARAGAYFDERGLAKDAAGYCALGAQEIKDETAVGRLLRMDN